MVRPLDGIRIVDLSRVLAGPYCTMLLADMGAEVIKVEMPKTGDDSRGYGPFIRGESTYFMSLNRNKKSITLNLRHEKGKQILKNLIKISDIVIENFRPGTMEKLGLSYETLKELNSRIIYAQCTGFGPEGPYSQRPAYDIIVQGMGGIMSITGNLGSEPVRVGASIGDITAGLFLAIGILSALRARELTGKGQKVDISMLDCQVAIMENPISRYLATGEVPKPMGTRHASVVPLEAFKSKDDYIIIAVGSESLWADFCRAIGCPELIDDPQFKNNALRAQNYNLLKPILQAVLMTKTAAEWMEILDKAGIPCGVVNTIDKVVNDPQVKWREMIVETDHPTVGKLKVIGVPIKLSETPGKVESPPPTLGQHTEEVLSGLLGMSREEIELLRKEQAL